MELVPDTSVVIDGRISERVEDGEFAGATVLVPEAVVSELEGQANDGRETGWEGLGELQRLLDLEEADELSLSYVGERPGGHPGSEAEVEADLDAVIREVAADRDATLVSSDEVQAETARAKGIDVVSLEPVTREVTSLAIEEYFDETTMSVHLKTSVQPMAKRGDVGEMRYEAIDEERLDESALREYAAEVVEGARTHPDGFVELDERGMTIVQFREYRIAVARPPFSDGLEITAVRPIVKTALDDYAHADALRDRLSERQRGVLIAGSPGAGKSTFAQAVAEYLQGEGVVVKTMEKPRDLQVGPEITQYTELSGEMAKTADSLLMVRPDYTIYDEVRKTDDFEVFADMRLAGVGMIGVVHATRAIDSLQRLIGRVELGLIPQVVDTVVFIEAGEVTTVYDVSTEVKLPEGLQEADLARPVIMVRDFETGEPQFEIYTFNRQVVTVPINDSDDSGVEQVAKQEIEREIRAIAQGHVDVELQGPNTAVVWVEEHDISAVIGKGGGRISDVEGRLGIDIDVRTHDERPDGGNHAGTTGGSDNAIGNAAGDSRTVAPEVTSQHVVIPVDGAGGETVEVKADGEYLFTATVSRGGEIQVSRGSAIAEELEKAIDHGRAITVS
jgi:ATPase